MRYILTRILRPGNVRFPSRSISDLSGTFVDRIQVKTAAGNGGPGCTSFARGPNLNIAPPDGGNGGDGGSIFLRATTTATSLRMSTTLLRAENGYAGMPGKRRGRRGEDLIVDVPRGTVIWEKQQTQREDDVWISDVVEKRVLVCELNEEDQVVEIGRGGRGGRGNAAFKSSRNRSPVTHDPGATGDARVLELELKTIADVGLVGFPNAGKSTFLRAVSAARPRVASYPFTTIRPHIGVVSKGERRMTVADIPGLIEGAHSDRGLGHEFLRHIERCVCLVYVVDVSERECVWKLRVLKKELEMHGGGLGERMACLVANKMDVGPESEENLGRLIEAVGDGMMVFPASSKGGVGVGDAVRHLLEVVS